MSGILDSFRLDGKVAWVTGASYGLGFAYAKAYAEAGAKVVFNDVNPEHYERGMEEYKKAGIDAYGALCDVTREDQVQQFVKDVEKNVGPIDILVNNAGIIKRIPMVEMELKDWQLVIDIDLTGPFICSKAVLPHMMEQKSGKIINACSMMSEFGRETVSAYAAAKGGLKMLTRNICSEYGQYNIQCNAIGPGYIATPQTAPLRARGEDGSMNPFDRFIRSKTPAQRWGHTEDLMGLAVFLASPASDFINGQVIYIDGGISAYIGQDPSNLDESKFAAEKENEDIIVKD
ncbi:MAG: gluconate 5-dehydrogenase [Lachnospiraceae bacterium]|nr:gluconate 5-dehydrogenase [Lachnospiraceae bacterium]MBQ8948053.1 gluconate 5-dehydrogenase [Lachnospiraceae bacterium]